MLDLLFVFLIGVGLGYYVADKARRRRLLAVLDRATKPKKEEEPK
jgi:hypothetical protein